MKKLILMRGAGMGGDNETVAGIVGLSVQDLQAERLAGKSLAQIAASKGLQAQAGYMLVSSRSAARDPAARRSEMRQMQHDDRMGAKL
ncbi:MAG: hypothetical protein ACM30E_13200 [Nitrososphaerales archaeon]